MTFIVSPLRELARILLALPFWSAVLQIAAGSFAPHQTDFALPLDFLVRNPLHHVAQAGDQTVVITYAVSHKDRALYREITSGAGDPLRVRLPMNPRTGWAQDPPSEAFVTTGSDWWYATLDEQNETPAVTFVKSDGSRITHTKPPALKGDITESHSFPMTAIPGAKPRVIAFNYKNDETIAFEIGWDGPARSWRLPPADYLGKVIAEPLSDGRIALIDNHSGLFMNLLADEGKVESIPLRNIPIQAFDAALDSNGGLVIVAARKDTGAIETARIDPTHVDRLEWRALHHDTHVAWRHYGLRVVATPDGFAAAWLDDANESKRLRIEAADIDRRGHWGPVVEVGRPTPLGDPFFEVQPKQDALLFWWDDGKRVVSRRLPASLTGYAALTALVPEAK